LELERRNKAFLDQSWANIIKDEEAEQRLLTNMDEQDQHQDYFQVVKSKSKLKKKSKPLKTSYITRGKTSGAPKPFR